MNIHSEQEENRFREELVLAGLHLSYYRIGEPRHLQDDLSRLEEKYRHLPEGLKIKFEHEYSRLRQDLHHHLSHPVHSTALEESEIITETTDLNKIMEE